MCILIRIMPNVRLTTIIPNIVSPFQNTMSARLDLMPIRFSSTSFPFCYLQISWSHSISRSAQSSLNYNSDVTLKGETYSVHLRIHGMESLFIRLAWFINNGSRTMIEMVTTTSNSEESVDIHYP